MLSFRCSSKAIDSRICGTVIAGVIFFPPPHLFGQKPRGDERQGLMMNMSTARRHLNATVLPDGTVLVTGGTSGGGFNDVTSP